MVQFNAQREKQNNRGKKRERGYKIQKRVGRGVIALSPKTWMYKRKERKERKLKLVSTNASLCIQQIRTGTKGIGIVALLTGIAGLESIRVYFCC
jgi:hypothetical protein